MNEINKKRSNLKAQLELKEVIEKIKEYNDLKENLKKTIDKMYSIINETKEKDMSVLLDVYFKDTNLERIRNVNKEYESIKTLKLNLDNVLKCEDCGRISSYNMYEINDEIICENCTKTRYKI